MVPGNVDDKLELDITALHGIRIIPTLIQRFLGGDPNAFGEILRFEGMNFDEAKVQVELADGRERTFNIERHLPVIRRASAHDVVDDHEADPQAHRAAAARRTNRG